MPDLPARAAAVECIFPALADATEFRFTFNLSCCMAPAHEHTNPMHGVTLQQILEELVAHYGWNARGQTIEIRCFTSDPSVASSLKFLRRTPWARQKVEAMYRDLLRVRARQPKAEAPPPVPETDGVA